MLCFEAFNPYLCPVSEPDEPTSGMSQRAAFDEILALMHRATLDDAYWPAACRLIEDRVQASSTAVVFGAEDAERGVQIFLARRFSRGEHCEELDREYFDVYYPHDERVPRIRRLPDSRPVHVTDLYTDRELKTSATYNEYLLPNDCGNSLIARLDGPRRSRIVFCIHDSAGRDRWTSSQVGLVQRLLPHIRQYVTVRQVLTSVGALGTSLVALLGNSGLGVIQLDWRGKIVDASDAARKLLRAGDGLFDAGGFLFSRSRADNNALQDLLSRALPPLGRQGIGGSIVLRRPPRGKPLALHITPVRRHEEDLSPWPVAALVLVVDSESSAAIDPNLVAEGLGLTQAEARVAVMLATGKSVREIAESTGRRISTIRTHVRHIFHKHGITRQVDLVRLVLSISAASS